MKEKILASVNGSNITQQDIENLKNKLDSQTATQYNTPEAEKVLLNELINQKLLFADAIDNDMEQEEAFKAELEKAKEYILTQLNINRTIKISRPELQEVKSHFDKNRDRFDIPQKADTSHILVSSQKVCEDIRHQIINDEISFEDAARKYSQCPSGKDGGKLGAYARGKMVAEYDNVSFSLEANEISKPVQTQFGFHLIKLNSKTEEKPVDFDSVKQQVFQDLVTEKQRLAYMEKIKELKDFYQIEIF